MFDADTDAAYQGIFNDLEGVLLSARRLFTGSEGDRSAEELARLSHLAATALEGLLADLAGELDEDGEEPEDDPDAAHERWLEDAGPRLDPAGYAREEVLMAREDHDLGRIWTGDGYVCAADPARPWSSDELIDPSPNPR